MRRAVPFAMLAGCLGVGVLPAFAADQTVRLHDSSYAPSRVAVMPGQTVTWDAEGTSLPHNVHFEGDVAPVGGLSTDFHGSRTFLSAGTFRYFCDVHGNAGMRGTVFVNASGTVPTPTATASPTASPTAAPTDSPTPSPSPSGSTTPGSPGQPGPTTGGGSTGGSGATVSSFRARAARSRFCTRRSAACRKPGVFLLIDLRASEPVRLRGTLKRGSRRVRAVSIRVRPGHRRVRLPGRRLKAGRYTLTLRAGDITRRVRFRVRPA